MVVTVKGLWNIRPYDWPQDVPYKDPNNGEKVSKYEVVLVLFIKTCAHGGMAKILSLHAQCSIVVVVRSDASPCLLFRWPRCAESQQLRAETHVRILEKEVYDGIAQACFVWSLGILFCFCVWVTKCGLRLYQRAITGVAL